VKNALLKFFVSRLGGVLTPLISGLVGAGLAKLAALDPQLASVETQAAVTGFVMAVILGAVNYWTNDVQTEGVKEIQREAGGLVVDGVPGPKTQAKVQRIARRGNPAR
jgi:membrane associated rhomboid family serine protease